MSASGDDSDGSAPEKLRAQGEWEKVEMPPAGRAAPVRTAGLADKPVDVGDGSSPEPQSFTADSPYLSSYTEKEMYNLTVLSDTVRDISARAKTFGKCGALMSEATRRLSQACKLQPSSSSSRRDSGIVAADQSEEEESRERAIIAERRESVGEEMSEVLKVLGKVSKT